MIRLSGSCLCGDVRFEVDGTWVPARALEADGPLEIGAQLFLASKMDCDKPRSAECLDPDWQRPARCGALMAHQATVGKYSRTDLRRRTGSKPRAFLMSTESPCA